MTFEQWKKKIYTLAKKEKIPHLLPGNNTLFTLWEQKVEPSAVISVCKGKKGS